jgi:hypothetical protein
MNYTSIEQSKHLLELGLSPNSADMFYRQKISERTDLPYYDIILGHSFAAEQNLFSFRNGYEIPCWSYDKMLDILTENSIGFEYKHARLSGHENIEIEVFKFDEEEDYIFRKHFKTILEAVEYCLENGYIEK